MNQNFIQRAIAKVMPAVRATGLQSAMATFQFPSQDWSTGFQADGWIDVSGLRAVACQLGPETDMNVVANEQRTQPMVTSTNLHRLELDGFYPRIETGWRGQDDTNPGPWRVLVTPLGGDEQAFTITGVENDSQSQVTRLRVQAVSI